MSHCLLHCVVAIILGQGRQIVKIQHENPEGKGKELVPDPKWCLDLI